MVTRFKRKNILEECVANMNMIIGHINAIKITQHFICLILLLLFIKWSIKAKSDRICEIKDFEMSISSVHGRSQS